MLLALLLTAGFVGVILATGWCADHVVGDQVTRWARGVADGRGTRRPAARRGRRAGAPPRRTRLRR